MADEAIHNHPNVEEQEVEAIQAQEQRIERMEHTLEQRLERRLDQSGRFQWDPGDNHPRRIHIFDRRVKLLLGGKDCNKIAFEMAKIHDAIPAKNDETRQLKEPKIVPRLDLSDKPSTRCLR
ncbi:hypothetical protein CRG98_012031 [Punica granatum]|uniref:Uncharacterized protein n=1 Tax=Punica granatum TaxID=22663 RepID=A0A2I0KG26_PUNGR|nr:hypothetical protein CRG98_012031 [Punica granatum]